MSRKALSQAEAEAKSLDAGVKMIDKYMGNKVKIKFLCRCGNIFTTEPVSIWTKKTKSCGCLKRETSIKLGQSNKGNTYKRKKLLNKKFGNLLVVEFYEIRNCGYVNSIKVAYWKCLCDCGNIVYINSSDLLSGHTKSCGCIRKLMCRNKRHSQERAEKKSLSVGIEMIDNYIGTDQKINFICPRCHNIFKTTPTSVWSGGTKSCGNCRLKRNAQTTSFKSLETQKLIPLITRHNHRIYTNPKNKSYYICVDNAAIYKGKKLAIEYDEWYWHGSRLKKDKERYNELVKRGWYVIRIRASNNLPTQTQINKALTLIDMGYRKVSITLPHWGSGPIKQFKKG